MKSLMNFKWKYKSDPHKNDDLIIKLIGWDYVKSLRSLSKHFGKNPKKSISNHSDEENSSTEKAKEKESKKKKGEK
jgi:hypothetical protein